MLQRVKQASYVRDYVIRIVFSDGTEGDVDFEKELDGEVFEPLRDLSYFKQFEVHSELHTLTWPNGADFAPEFLYDKIKITV